MAVNTEEKAFADWFIVKREILWSYYEAAKAFAMIVRNRERGAMNTSYGIEFKKFVCELYLKLRPKLLDKKSGLIDKKYEIIDGYIKMKIKKMTDNDWLDTYYNLQDKVEDLGITKIERRQLAPEECVMDGV